ncbi:hypothetical protein I3843_11G043300 [Carya illinoinensis]|nr:hypothetical protein I3843_11G043300 [Carya illinoinensis]
MFKTHLTLHVFPSEITCQAFSLYVEYFTYFFYSVSRDRGVVAEDHFSRNLLVNGIVVEQKGAFVLQIFFHILEGYNFNFKGQFHPLCERTSPCNSVQRYLVCLRHICLPLFLMFSLGY